MMAILRRVMFPRSGRSLRPARRWLLAGTRLSTVAIGICLALGVREWYFWIPIATAVLFLFADLPLAYRDRRAGKNKADEPAGIKTP
jgi:CHASE2 domain-containing sensor protein